MIKLWVPLRARKMHLSVQMCYVTHLELAHSARAVTLQYMQLLYICSMGSSMITGVRSQTVRAVAFSGGSRIHNSGKRMYSRQDNHKRTTLVAKFHSSLHDYCAVFQVRVSSRLFSHRHAHCPTLQLAVERSIDADS